MVSTEFIPLSHYCKVKNPKLNYPKLSWGQSVVIKKKRLLIYAMEKIAYMEKAMAPHSSTLAWKIPWMEEPGGLQFTGSQNVRLD